MLFKALFEVSALEICVFMSNNNACQPPAHNVQNRGIGLGMCCGIPVDQVNGPHTG